MGRFVTRSAAEGSATSRWRGRAHELLGQTRAQSPGDDDGAERCIMVGYVAGAR